MLHRVEGHLLLKTLLVYLQELLDLLHALLLHCELSSKIISLGELVGHFIIHLLDLLLSLLHFFLDSSFEVFDLLQVALNGFALDLEPGSRGFTVLQLVLLEPQVFAHVLDLLLGWQFVLSGHGLLHVLEQLRDDVLIIINLPLVLNLVHLELLLELVDFLLLLVEDLVLLLLTSGFSFLHILINFLNVCLIGVDHLLNINLFLFQLFQFNIALFYPVLESVSGFLW